MSMHIYQGSINNMNYKTLTSINEPLKKLAPKNFIMTFKAKGSPRPTAYTTVAAIGTKSNLYANTVV